jgi:hypothetical protein
MRLEQELKMALFFKESARFADRNGKFFDFVETSSAALWNLRWQVQGFVSAVPSATSADLSNRFTTGSGITANNLKATCLDTTWDDQLGQFSQLVVSTLVSMFESWAEDVMPRFGSKDLVKWVQFPSKGNYGQRRNGVREALHKSQANGISTEMRDAFYPAYSRTSKYNPQQLDALLVVYRYHKEIRNAFMHRGGVANADNKEAWRQASQISQSDLGGKIGPKVSEPTLGEALKVDLKESIQLADILLRIITTIDSELCYTKVAEEIFVQDWISSRRSPIRISLSNDPVKRSKRLTGACKKAGYVEPADIDAIRKIGIRAGLVSR